MTLDLSAIEARAKAATAGPWRIKPNIDDDWGYIRGPDGSVVAVAKPGSLQSDSDLNRHRRNRTDPTQHNMDFIAHAREDIPALIARVRELEAENRQLHEREFPHQSSRLSPKFNGEGCYPNQWEAWDDGYCQGLRIYDERWPDEQERAKNDR